MSKFNHKDADNVLSFKREYKDNPEQIKIYHSQRDECTFYVNGERVVQSSEQDLENK